jgi:hypothetical protein
LLKGLVLVSTGAKLRVLPAIFQPHPRRFPRNRGMAGLYSLRPRPLNWSRRKEYCLHGTRRPVA